MVQIDSQLPFQTRRRGSFSSSQARAFQPSQARHPHFSFSELLPIRESREALSDGLVRFAGGSARAQRPRRKSVRGNRHHDALLQSHPHLYETSPDGIVQPKKEKLNEIKALIAERIGVEFKSQIDSTGIVKWAPLSDRPPFRAEAFVGMNTSRELHFRLGKTIYAIRPESYLPIVISGPGKPEWPLLLANSPKKAERAIWKSKTTI